MRTITYFLSLILIFMIPWEDSITIGSVGSLARLIGLATAACWVFTVLLEGKFRKPHPFHLAVFLFFLWNLASAFWSLGIGETETRIKTYAQLAVLVLLLWDVYAAPATLQAGLQAYVLGAWVAVASTISNYIAGNEFRVYSGGRYSADSVNPGDLVLLLAIGLPIAWHLAASVSNGKDYKALRLVNFAYIPAALFGIALTGSRLSLFTAVPAILYIVVEAIRLNLAARIMIFVALLGAILIMRFYLPQTSIDRLATTGMSTAAFDFGGRAVLWREAIAEFSAHPIIGVGSGAFRSVNELGSAAHNTFLSVLADLGIVGFVLFVAILVIVGYQAVNQPKTYAGLWSTVLVIWVLGASAQTWEQRKPTWLILSFVIISASMFFQRDLSVHHQQFPAKYRAAP